MNNKCLICNQIIDKELDMPLCSNCDDKFFNSIRDFINNNPNAHTSDIYNNTKIPLIILKKYLDDSRLEYVSIKLKNSNDICFYCGDKITTGKTYCSNCLNNLKLIEHYKMNDMNYFENSSKTYSETGVKKHLKIKK